MSVRRIVPDIKSKDLDASRHVSVAIQPGARQFTRMPSVSANGATAYAVSPLRPRDYSHCR